MIRIAHCSDTHNRPSIVREVANVDCDVIVLTGDILANKGRQPVYRGWDGVTYRIDPAMERTYQRTWFRRVAKKWAADFKGRPVVYVPGNHDFIGIEHWMRHYGHDAVYTISSENPFVDVCGKRFAGFREVPWIDGEWEGEHRGSFAPMVDRTFDCNPDIIVTHAPPAGILDDDGYGMAEMTSAMFYREHKVTHYMFGHAHANGEKIITEGGVTFSNAAGHMNIIDVM